MLYNLLFVPSVVCRKSFVNLNNFHLFYEQIVKKCPKNVFKVNFVKILKKINKNKNNFNIISITQNTFYTYGPTFRNTRQKVAFASKSQP